MILTLLACYQPELGYVAGDDPLWDRRAIGVFDLTLPDDDWQAAALAGVDPNDDCADRPYLQGDLQFTNPATGEVEDWPDVGFRLRGHASLRAAVDGGELPGYKLSFEEFAPDRLFHDQSKLDLLGTEGDFTFLRENLALLVNRRLGVPAPRTGLSLLYVNGEYEGFHAYTEEPDDRTYIYNHFPAGGHLYKASGYCSTGGLATLEWVSDDPADYLTVYEPKGSTDEQDVADELIPLLRCASETTDEEFVACIPEHIDVEEWLREIAVDHVLPDVDGLAGRAHNYMLFRDAGAQRFVVYPWDKDQTFYTWELTDAATPFDIDLSTNTEIKPVLVERLQTLFHDDYCAALRDTVDAADPAVLEPEMTALGQLLWDPLWFDERLVFDDWKNGVQSLIDEHEVYWEAQAEAVDAGCP